MKMQMLPDRIVALGDNDANVFVQLLIINTVPNLKAMIKCNFVL